jgi:rhodanese-related sulfurtransferase
LVESKKLVGTSGHCFLESNGSTKAGFTSIGTGEATIRGVKYQLSALFSGPHGYSEIIPLKVLDAENSVIKGHTRNDWAILELEKEPANKSIKPIALLSPGEWTKRGRISALTLGYSGDLYRFKKATLGANIVHGDHCDFTGSMIRLKKTDQEKNILLSTIGNGVECVSSQGDSGGPLVIWNDSTSRYEVLGIVSHGSGSVKNIEKGMTPEAVELYEKQKKKLIEQYGDLLLSSGESMVPGFAQLAKKVEITASMYYDSDGWVLPLNFLNAVKRYLGDSSFDKSYYLSIFENPTSLSSDLPEHRSTRYLTSWAAARAARANLFRTGFRIGAYTFSKQLKLTVGDKIDIKKIDQEGYGYDFLHLSGLSGMGSQVFLNIAASKANEPNGKNNFLVVNGDLFGIDPDTLLITEVTRNWMYFVDANDMLDDWAQFFPHRYLKPRTNEYQPRSKVEPTNQLRSTNFGALTPASIEGASLIDTREVWELISEGFKSHGKKAPRVFAAVNDTYGLPTAVKFYSSSQGGEFNDFVQESLLKRLKEMGVAKADTIITYCHHDNCWLSYNLSLRLINAGYTGVRWYRDGMGEWLDQMLPIQAAK